MAKKVLMLLTNCFDPDPRVFSEAKTLTERGYQVRIIGWDRDFKRPKHQNYHGIKVERIYLRSTHGRGTSQVPFLMIFWLLALLKALGGDFDVVHCHDLDTLPLGVVLAKLSGKKIIFDAHESFADMLGTNVHKAIKRMIFAVENLLLPHLDLLITVGEILGRTYRDRGARRVCVVGNWKHLEDFALDQATLTYARKKLGIPRDKLVISFISWLGPERKLVPLLEAVRDDPEVFLLLGGKGPMEEEARRAAAISPRILWLGFVPPQEIPLYTCLSDMVFYGFDQENPNSQYSAPNKLFEALAAGKAVLTGDFGEIGHIVREWKCGVVMDETNTRSIQKAFSLLKEKGRVREYGRNAQAAAREHYNWRMAARLLTDAYRSLWNKETSPATQREGL
ncbi:glycosyltransferase family 4 protein [bacterium]|nr:glycosyltransferase family 4 protein [bacterium]MCK4596843.1 glycosyltransferase family 4 protein [bacterium]